MKPKVEYIIFLFMGFYKICSFKLHFGDAKTGYSVAIFFIPQSLTHWGGMTHVCVGKLTIIGSDNGLSPGRRQAIVWTNAGILLIWPLGTSFNKILIGIQTFSFKKMHLKMSSAKWRPFCLGLNVLKLNPTIISNIHWHWIPLNLPLTLEYNLFW